MMGGSSRTDSISGETYFREDCAVAIRIGINGFGRIGRMAFRAMLDKKEVEVVAVNDITDAKTLAHLLKHDSVHGSLKQQVKAEGNQIMLNGHAFRVLAERDPAKLPWKELKVDVVIESTGLFTAREKAALHYADLFKQGEHAIDKDEVYADLAKHFNDEEIIELGLFCAEVDGVGKFVKSLNVLSWEEACELNPKLKADATQIAAE